MVEGDDRVLRTAYVVWYDQDEWEESSKQICDADPGLHWVDGTSIDAYVKAHRSVMEAEAHDHTSDYRCPETETETDEQP